MTQQKTPKSRPKLSLKLPKSHATLAERKARKGWFFVLPFVLGFVLIYLPIVIDSIWFTFGTLTTVMEYDPSVGTPMPQTIFTPTGFENYKEAFATSDYVTTLGEGILNLLWEVPAIVIFSLFVAVILNQKMIGRAAFRAIFFVPVIIATGLMDAVNAADTLSGDDGVDTGTGTEQEGLISMMDVQLLFSNMKIGSGLVDFVVGLVNDIYNIVNYSGVQMLIFLAGLQSISPAIYEAGRIDGASSWETFWKITFPMISPMILVNGVYTIIDSFTRESNAVMTYIQTIYDSHHAERHLATAESWMYVIIVMLIVAAFAGIASLWVFYQKKES